jgi:hypothetical protein
MFAAILGVLGPIFGRVASSLFPNPEDELRRIELQQQLQMALLADAARIEQAAADIVKTEAASEHWLASNWRPLLMLVFAGLIVARWFGFTTAGITEAVELKLWSILELGIGGYVIGRSVEKALPSVAEIIKNKK